MPIPRLSSSLLRPPKSAGDATARGLSTSHAATRNAIARTDTNSRAARRRRGRLRRGEWGSIAGRLPPVDTRRPRVSMSAVSRSQSPASRARRPSRLPRSSAVFVAVLAAVTGAPWLASRTTLAAADPPADILDTPIVDVAFVDRGADGPPDILTLSLEPDQPGTGRLTLLERGET